MENIMYWLFMVSFIVFFVNLLILLPISISKRAKPYIGLGLLYSSYIYGITAWFSGVMLTLELWGIIALIIGLTIVGVGVIPIAMLATLINGEWESLVVLVLLAALTLGVRILGISFTKSTDIANF